MTGLVFYGHDLLLPQQLQDLFLCQLVRKIRTFGKELVRYFFV